MITAASPRRIDAIVTRCAVLDNDGNVVPYADNEISFTCTGGAGIITPLK